MGEQKIAVGVVIVSEQGSATDNIELLCRPNVGDLWDLQEMLDEDSLRSLNLTNKELNESYWQIKYVVVQMCNNGESYTVFVSFVSIDFYAR